VKQVFHFQVLVHAAWLLLCVPRLIVLKALVIVIWEFRDKKLKSSGQPYVLHLLETAQMLRPLGTTAVVAGLLHDIWEDIPCWTWGRLQENFGLDITDIIHWVSHQDCYLSWPVRTRRYIERLRLPEAPAIALALSCADKISQLERDNRAADKGISHSTYMQWPKEAYCWKFETIFSALEGRVDEKLLARYQRAYEQYCETVDGETIEQLGQV